MALAYLLDPCLQHQNRAGVNNVDGWFEVFRMDTDDRATVYTDFNGTLAPARNVIDNNGRVVMIAESGVAYRVAMYLPNGELVYTQQPVFTVGSGGGAGGSTEITSSDGSINVDKTSIGSDTTFDISVARDGMDLLEYVRCDGATQLPDSYIYRPTYTEGTIMVGEQGLVLSAGHYYHVTAHVRATKSVQRDPFYDEVNIRFVLDDGTSQTDCVVEKRIVDYSLGLSQEFEVSTDVMPSSNCELLFVIDGHDVQNGSFQLLDVEAHRVYSGAPYIPSGVLTRDQTAEIYQEKLIAGDNITIEGNVISATGGGGGGSTYTAGDGVSITSNVISADVDGTTIGIDSTTKKIKLLSAIPTVDQVYSASSTNAQSGVAVAGAIASISVDEVPAVTSSDDAKVLTATYSGGVGSYAWAAAQSGPSYTAGTGIDISAQDAISVKIDGSTITTNSSGQLVANGGGGGGGGGSASTYKFVIEQAHTYNLFTSGDFVFTVSLTGTNEQHLCISSSTVSGACISRQRTLFSGGGYGITGSVMGTTPLVQYTPTSLSSEVQLFRITDVDTTAYPRVEDFTLFYEKNGSPYVFNIKTFTIYTEISDPDQGTIRTRTMYISVG